MKLLIPAALVLTCGTAHAAPLDPSWIGPESTWMIHLDIEAFSQTSIGSFVMQQIQNEINIDVGEVQFGDHPELSPQQIQTIIRSINEVKDVTIVGTEDTDDPSLVVFRAGPGVLDVIEMLKMQEGLKTVEQDGRAIVLLDEGQPQELGSCFIVQPTGLPNENYVILAESVESLVRHIGQSEDRRKGGGRSAPEWARPAQNAFLHVYFQSVADFVDDPDVPVIGSGGSMQLSVGEQHQRLNADLSLDAADAQQANDMVAALQGFMAMGRLMMSSEPDLAELQPFLNGISMRADGSNVLINATWDSDSIRTLVQDHMDDDDDDEDEDDVHEEIHEHIQEHLHDDR